MWFHQGSAFPCVFTKVVPFRVGSPRQCLSVWVHQGSAFPCVFTKAVPIRVVRCARFGPEKQLRIAFWEMLRAGGMHWPIREPVRFAIVKSSNSGFWHLPTPEPRARLVGAPSNPWRRSHRPECGVTDVRARRPRLGRRSADRLRLRAPGPVFAPVGCCGQAVARSLLVFERGVKSTD